MFKKMLVILIVLLLSGCDNNEESLTNQINEKDKLIKEFNAKINDQTDIINNLENENLILEETININKENAINLKDQISSLETDIEELEYDLTVNQTNDAEMSVFESYFVNSLHMTKDIRYLEDEIINKEEARKLFFEAQNFNNYMFRFPVPGTFTPKDQYSDLYGNDIDKVGLKNWFLVNNNGHAMSKEDFDNEILSYFTEDMIEEYSQHIVELGDGEGDIIPTWSQCYGIYNNQMYVGHFHGANAVSKAILREHCVLDLEYISEERDLVRYKIYIPMVRYDDYLLTYTEMIYIEEIIEFEKTINGWRLNAIPKTYESEM